MPFLRRSIARPRPRLSSPCWVWTVTDGYEVRIVGGGWISHRDAASLLLIGPVIVRLDYRRGRTELASTMSGGCDRTVTEYVAHSPS
jgi:hypothetical protein